jgi:hypothetical protein
VAWALDQGAAALGLGEVAAGVLRVAAPTVLVVLFVVVTGLTYRYVPARRVPMRVIARPAIAAGLVLAAFTQAFAVIAPRLVGSAALYGTFNDHYEQLQGKELSYNNILDITAATYLIGEFERPTVAILKHTNPCGVASADTLSEAWAKAYATDRQAPFGGIIIVNNTLDVELAQQIAEIFTEVIIAPRFSPEAREIFSKKKNLRLMIAKEGMGPDALQEIRSVIGGVLVQDRDRTLGNVREFKVVTKRQPTSEEWAAMMFGWIVGKHV